MPTVESTPAGAPIWFDLSTSDPAVSSAFYEGVFGWTAQDPGPDYGGYINFFKGDAQIAGMMRNPGLGMPDGWTVYLKSDDVEATTAAITASGGTLIFPAMDVMELGRMAVAQDPTGTVVGIWQPGTMTGFELAHEASTPVWHELHTRDYEGEIDFYRTAFGWQTAVLSDTEDFRYTTLTVDGAQYAGIMDGAGFLPEGQPSTWEIYIGVEDVDATVEKALALGGSLVIEAEDTPFGRIAKVADPTGGTFKLSSLPVAG
ncbi:MAG: VOC family protein [Burkholderiaceae bacterium]|nr:VOC family protein [Microbacteriaceae bacterium]